jgi:cytochrome c-type biogenesis protein CcmE
MARRLAMLHIGAFGPLESQMDRPTPEELPRAVDDDGHTLRSDHDLALERRPHRLPLFVLGAVVVLALGWLAVDAFQGSVVYYLTPTEALADVPAGDFRLAGNVTDGSIHTDPVSGEFRFEVTDGVTTVPVRFDGRPPDSLTDGAEAVAQGRLGADGVFVADTVLARCASRFEAEWDEA